MKNYRVEMGARMKHQRKMLHMTQEELAEKLNISVKHYGGVERGNAGLSLENLVEVSNILGMNLDYMIKGEEHCKEVIPSRVKEIYLNSTPEKRQYILFRTGSRYIMFQEIWVIRSSCI